MTNSFSKYFRVSIVALIVFPIVLLGHEVNAVSHKAEYKKVSVEELVRNPKRYDDELIIVNGQFQDLSAPRPIATVVCPRAYQLISRLKYIFKITTDRYMAAYGYGIWGISDQGYTVVARILPYKDKDGILVAPAGLPNYQKGQQIELKGRAHYARVSGDSCSANWYKSVYVEAKGSEINTPVKPIPKF